VTPERRQALLDYIAAKYPKGGKWNLKMTRPVSDGGPLSGEADGEQEEPSRPPASRLRGL
jgi:hypothetical protein